MTFETNRKELVQEQFQVIEIDTIDINGTCTLSSGGEGYYTPLTCIQQTPQVVKTTYFATTNTPLQFGSSRVAGDGAINVTSPIYRVVNSIAENTTVLKPSEGLAGRGTLRVTFGDFLGDPSAINPTNTGTFFGKYVSRNVFANKEIRVKYFHVKTDGTAYTEADALTKTYTLDTISKSGKGVYTASAKDELTKADKDKSQFPQPTDGSLRLDIDELTTSIPVDIATTYAVNDVIYVGGEFMRVLGVSGILTSTATLTVDVRGSDIVGLSSTELLSKSVPDSHSEDDTIQICVQSDNQRIDELIKDILVSVDVPLAKIPESAWVAEVDEWHNGVRINTLWFDPRDSNVVIKEVLVAYLMDLWYDPVDVEVKLSAISVWKNTDIVLQENKHIDFDTLTTSPLESMRFSRAYIFRDKPFLAEDDGIKNYRGLAVFKNVALETSALYGEPKTKEFKPNPIISRPSAQLLVQRFVSRFGHTPVMYRWTTQERFLDFKTGDIVSIESDEVQDHDGTQKQVRAQILNIKPRLGKLKREYQVKALTYEAAFQDGSEFVLSGNNCEINLHVVAGAPSQVVDLTYIIDGGVLCGIAAPSVIAGNFAAGSKITIILINGAEWQGFAGAGGTGGTYESIVDGEDIIHEGLNGGDGGTCYDAQGIDTDIYLSGTIGAYTANGILVAPGGGGGGSASGLGTDNINTVVVGGTGGGGGAGFNLGVGGGAGNILQDGQFFTSQFASSGNNGDTAGNGGLAKSASAVPHNLPLSGAGGDWGEDGTGAEASANTTTGTLSGGGLRGKGVIQNGAIVCLFGANAGNFINGGGDTTCLSDAPPLISNISSGVPSSTSVTVTWDTDVPATSQIEYGLTVGYGSNTVKNNALTTSHGQTITGLTLGTEYHFKVISDSATAVTGESVDQVVTTSASADVTPPVVSNILAIGTIIDQATITWDTDEGATSQIEYGLTVGYGNLTTEDPTLDSMHSHDVTGLVSSTEYHYRIITTDASSNTTTTADQVFNTSTANGATVTLPGGNVSADQNDNPVTNAQAVSGISFTESGSTFQMLNSAAGTATNNLTRWADPFTGTEMGAGFEIKFTKTGGTEAGIGSESIGLPGWSSVGCTDVWRSLDQVSGQSQQSVIVSRFAVDGVGSTTLVFDVAIRAVGTTDILETKSYTLTAQIV